jgi:hypothetical protein
MFRTLVSRQAQADLYHEDFEDRSVLAILHGRGWDIWPSISENFVVWAASFRLTPVLDRALVSPAGTTIFEVYWLDGRRTQAVQTREGSRLDAQDQGMTSGQGRYRGARTSP